MYQETRKITIFSEHTSLEPLIRSAMEKGPVAYTISTTSSMQTDWQDSDIILCDIPVEELASVKKKMRSDSYLLYIYSPADDICRDKDTAADELFARPVSKDYLQKRIRHICGEIKLRADEWLSSTYLDVLIDSMPDLVWFKDNNGIHVKVNNVFCHTVGKERKDVTGKDHCTIWDVEVDDCEATEAIVRRERRTCQFNELVKSSGGMRQFRTYKSPLFDRDGNIMGTVGIGHDVTVLENMSNEMEILLNSMPFAILLKDSAGAIVDVNLKFEEYFSSRRDDVIGRPFHQWHESMFHGLSSVKKNDTEEIHLPEDDGERILEITHEPIYDIFESIVGELTIYRDITEESLLKEQLNNNSNTDFLTGLCNRRFFYEYFSETHSYEQISILYVDLDHFKMVNDTYGHQIGDEALIMVAATLKKCFPDNLIARIGGDEFLVARTEPVAEEELVRQADMLIDGLQDAFNTNSCMKVLSASIGIAYTTEPAKKIDDLIKESDIALYKAKQSGRSRCCVYR
ncbi:diguanylate cyclase [[Clostridium] hylemonae]|nr:diguanylate cyclase [[Clostridium] hylemonae]